MNANNHRREYKFIIQHKMAESLRELVENNLSVDRELKQGYFINTQYYDTENDLFYWQKIDRRPNRRRLRTRIYLDPDGRRDATAFIEIKHKIDGITVKRRVSSTPEEIATFSRTMVVPEGDGKESKIRNEINQMIGQFKLIPRVSILYHRYAYDTGANGKLRITFDHDVRCSFASTNMTGPGGYHTELEPILDGASLMEVKTIGAVPLWFRKICGIHGLIPTSFSKYSASIEFGNKKKTNNS